MIYVVSGHPRSGTSMMMAALEAGGMICAHSDDRERHNRDDGSYKPNRGGLYELPTTEQWQPGWPRQYDGQVVKCLTRWVRHLSVHEYRVVFMLRDAEEVRQSYRAAFGAVTTCAQIQAETDEALRSLHNRRDVRDVQCVRYAQMLDSPESTLRSLMWPVRPAEGARIVDPEQYRFRRERLVAGL